MVVIAAAGVGAALWLGAPLREGASDDGGAFPQVARPTRHFRVERPADLAGADALVIYDRILEDMVAAYGKSGDPFAEVCRTWRRYNVAPYLSATHGERYVNNYANSAAIDYGKAEEAGTLPIGSVLAKDAFEVTERGDFLSAPLSLMEKMPPGFSPRFRDWRYTMIMPEGSLFGTTGGEGSERVEFCGECHIAAGDQQDHLFFVPEEYRTKFLNPTAE